MDGKELRERRRSGIISLFLTASFILDIVAASFLAYIMFKEHRFVITSLASVGAIVFLVFALYFADKAYYEWLTHVLDEMFD
jgi:hypothetical protein